MTVIVHPDRASLVGQTADRLAALLAELTEAQGRATIALTGGSVGIELLAALADRAVDWERVHVTWSDERFVPADSPTATPGRRARRCSTACRSPRATCTSCPPPPVLASVTPASTTPPRRRARCSRSSGRST